MLWAMGVRQLSDVLEMDASDIDALSLSKFDRRRFVRGVEELRQWGGEQAMEDEATAMAAAAKAVAENEKEVGKDKEEEERSFKQPWQQ